MLIDPATLAAFGLACLAVYVAPGADMAYIGGTAMSGGLRRGLWAALGTVTGVAVQAFATAFGVVALFVASPILFEAVRWAGVAYLAYLGVRMLMSASQTRLTQIGTVQPLHLMAKGAAINLLNPKISLFFLAFLPQFADPGRGSMTRQLLILGGLFTAGALVWCLFQAYAFARAGHWLAARPRLQLWQERATGGAMLVFAGMLAASGVRR
ncbi:LysE family translocator [Rhodoligotrophos defluvii]|uniref:LysE family translocator n=1 Tax=Rhodoligotrophos defluvii TaxID=2561934 RepID=UPI0010C98D89|nr:LysE family translocator [Rhodoligotrophos defluvii]